MKKCLILVCLLFSLIQASGIGFKGQFVMNEIGPGAGFGVLGMIDLAEVFSFYPNFDFWYAQDRYSGRYWEHDHWVYYDSYGNFNAYEFAFNFDGAFKIPVRIIEPYLGLGIAVPVIIENNVEAGLNMFGGILFPLGTSCTGLVELRGKAGITYSVFKVSFGVILQSRRHR